MNACPHHRKPLLRRVLFLLLLIGCLTITAAAAGTNKAGSISLEVPKGVTLTFYRGVSTESGKMTPASVTTNGDITTYYYEGLASGGYCYQVSGTGYYTLKKNIYYSAEDAKTGCTIDANPGKKAGNGYEQSMVSSYKTVCLNTDEMQAGVLNKTWPDKYDALLTSPYFTRRNSLTSLDGLHQQTTHEEMTRFLETLDDPNDNMYVYTFGESPKYKHPFQVVVFSETDLSGAATLEAAAAILNTAANTKPTVQYQAQVHSNEPAATEAALVMAKQLDGAFGQQVLKTIDVVLIPRINADGAQEWRRTSATNSEDMNRDYLSLNNKEIQMVVSVYNLFDAEVTIDGHEYNDYTTSTSGTVDDIQMVGAGGALNNPAELTNLAQAIMEDTLSHVSSEFGLRGDAYSNIAYGVNPSMASSYMAVRGGICFLMETRGIHNGMAGIDRRVMSQYAAASNIISYTAEHAAAVAKTVADSRGKIAAQGATYEESDQIVLKHGTGTTKKWTVNKYDFLTGKQTGSTTNVWGYYDVALRSRTRPTAYIIPKDLKNAEKIVDLLSRHEIAYYELGTNSSAKVQQYMGDSNNAMLTEERTVTFRSGAYVFPMNQAGATVLALIMEPDVSDTVDYDSTLVRMGLVSPESSGAIPIYRYCYDLDANGKIAAETNAVFTDEASITYSVAVAKIAEMNIVGGYGDGSFGPKNKLSRGAAAKIICGMMLSADEIAALPKDVSVYPDVAAGSTFAPYINYLQEKGIIGGYADGTFRPGNDLSAPAFLKMLLGALGYSAEAEQFYGTNSSANVLAKANSLKLADGLKTTLTVNSGCTREEACLYAFNTLNALAVTYKNGIAVPTGKTYLEAKYSEQAKESLSGTLVNPQDEPMQEWLTEVGVKSNGSAVVRFVIPSNIQVKWDTYHFTVTAANGHKMEMYRKTGGTWDANASKEIGAKVGSSSVSASSITFNSFDSNDIGQPVTVEIIITTTDGITYSVNTAMTLSSL